MSKRINPLLALSVNIILDRMGIKSTQPSSEDNLPELADLPCVKRLASRDGAVAVVLGKRESGKTVLCYRLAEIIGRPTYAVSPEQKPPHGVQNLKLEQLSELPPPYSTLFLDDAPVYMGSRDYSNVFVQQVERLIPVVRHTRKLILLFASQTSGQADKWILDADIVILKPMGWLYEDIERPAVKKLADRVMPIFQQMSEMKRKKHCYIFSDDYQGLARIDLPRSLHVC